MLKHNYVNKDYLLFAKKLVAMCYVCIIAMVMQDFHINYYKRSVFLKWRRNKQISQTIV